MAQWTRTGGRRRAALVAISLLATLVPLVTAPAGAGPVPAPTDSKIEAALLTLPGGKSVDFWVTFRAEANLDAASQSPDWDDRGRQVVDRLLQAASSSQAGVAAFLAAKGIAHESYWISNTTRVTGTTSLMRDLAARPEVDQVVADRTFALPDPIAAEEEITPASVDWNLSDINAPAVWDQLGVRGEGVVVANLDSGVQFDHPALVGQYRGNQGGIIDHNYNWFDATGTCGSPAPCDPVGHGTHTMGTMVGADPSGQDTVGVAPGARWIAVKGCAASCTTSNLLAAGQWLLAPTDLNGQNPRPDLRPNIVNNSWSGPNGNTFFRDVVTAWVAAGIFPVFAAGNSGPYCGTAGSPADYPESYAVGAYNSTGAIASYSGRGYFPSFAKPDIAAPGHAVRSTYPTSTYAVLNGTSMAAPHVAGTVALMWSAAPSLVSNVAQTRALLDQAAVDVDDETCGGTAADNGVFGQGRLDAFAAVQASPRPARGTVSGTVTDVATGAPVSGAMVSLSGPVPVPRMTLTGADGTFSLVVPVGTYTSTVAAFGYVVATGSVTVTAGGTTVADTALVPQARWTVSGTVTDLAGAGLADVAVSIPNTPIAAATTDANGFYSIGGVPPGTYAVTFGGKGCLGTVSRTVAVAADVVVDVGLTTQRDGFGYGCRLEPSSYIEAGTVLPLTGDDASMTVQLPFTFRFYGRTVTAVDVTSNGVVALAGGFLAYENTPIPTVASPNLAIYALWDDLYVDSSASVRTATLGTKPTQRFVIEWRNIRFFSGSDARFDMEVILDQSGRVLIQYRGLTDDLRTRGGSATIGIEDLSGTTATQFAYNTPLLPGPDIALWFDTVLMDGNVAPTAVDDDASTNQDQGLAVRLVDNDIDPNLDTLSVTAVGSPAHGSNWVNPDGTVQYYPSYRYVGTDSFTYDMTDGRGGSDRATVTITVNAPVKTTTTSTSTTSTVPATTTSTTPRPTTSTSTTTTTRPPAATLRAPYSWWAVSPATPLDGIGTWVATANDPTAGPDQVPVGYRYALGFNFAGDPSARGVIALTTGPLKTAAFTVVPPTGTPLTLSIPFHWTADRFYFLFVHKTATPGGWGALVFDLTANAWTPIGALTLPTAWGQLSPSAITAVGWSGTTSSSCAAYPTADVVVHSPTGFLNGAAIDARLTQTETTGGTCPAENTIGPGGWVRYRAGGL